jgi:hypothetical protein
MKEWNEKIKVDRFNSNRKNVEVKPKLNQNTIVVIKSRLFIRFLLVVNIENNNCKIDNNLE